MDAAKLKLKALKVVDLKHILASASVSAPAKATKNDLIAKITASEAALDAYYKLYPPDDLLAPPEEYVPSYPVFAFLHALGSTGMQNSQNPPQSLLLH